MGYVIFGHSGKVDEISTEGDTENPHEEEGRGRNHAGCSSGKEEITPRERVPHR